MDMAPERIANPSIGNEREARAMPATQESSPTGAALGETVKVGLDRAGVLVKDAADKTRDTLAGYRDGEVFAQVLDDVVEFVRRQPMTALLIATGVGLVVGILLAHGRQTERG
jgi:ElaB/YqjD/DUF883 family membrane-anchored ribosome-binding protein